MGKKILWAPWRIEYILHNNNRKCIFCPNILSGSKKDSLILYRGPMSMVMMNRYPYNNGHLLVSPLKHIPDLEGLTPQEMKDLFLMVRESVRILKKVMDPDGFNIGINLGRVAGAGIEGHVHFHIVPRWNGDTSCMTVISEIRVIPEHLMMTYEKLLPHFYNLEKIHEKV
ncbi:MAG TPA: HIT domain-containing protein [Syntrophaceae bacterium]|nr:HIT domain-containing protein [Syntrophaceae bacterium]